MNSIKIYMLCNFKPNIMLNVDFFPKNLQKLRKCRFLNSRFSKVHVPFWLIILATIKIFHNSFLGVAERNAADSYRGGFLSQASKNVSWNFRQNVGKNSEEYYLSIIGDEK